jgi:hypothetical protein
MNKQDKTALVHIGNVLCDAMNQAWNDMVKAREERGAHDPGTPKYEAAHTEVLKHASAYDRARVALSAVGMVQYHLHMKPGNDDLKETIGRLMY